MYNDIKHIEINLGKVCNNRCLFCMTGSNNPISFVPFSEVKKEIENYSRKGFTSLGFLGGEPTIYPNIIEAVEYAKISGFKVIHLVSNGRRYSDMNFLKSLIRSGVNRFSVSIHSHIPEIEDELTQVNGGFEHKIRGIKNLITCQRKGLIKSRISINIVINKLNHKTLLETLVFFKRLGITEFRLNYMRPEGRAFSNFDKLGVRYSECVPTIKQILDYTRTMGFGATIEGFPPCVLSNINKPERFLGELKDYLNLVVSFNVSSKQKISKDTFSWKKRRVEELKVKGDDCKKCKFNDICEGVWKGYVEKVGFDEFKPVEY